MRAALRAVAGDLVAIAIGVTVAYVVGNVWLYRKATRRLDPSPDRPRSVP